MLYDVVQVGMASRHDDGDEVLYSLVNHHFAFEEKQFALLGSREPAQEQAVTHGLLVVGTIAHIEHDVRIGTEELYDDWIIVSRTFGSLGEALPLRFVRSNQ